MRKYLVPISFSVLISLLLTASGIYLYHMTYSREKIGYVRTGVILKNYAGMQEATGQFNQESVIVHANIDTLKKRYESLKAGETAVSAKEKADWGYRLGVAENEYFQYSQTAQQQMQQRQEELTKNVLAKVNGFIHQYGKDRSYRLILGTTNDGSILYGTDYDDLTDEVLGLLNNDYASREKQGTKK